MKICPKCRAEFEEKFNFCLQDGTPLVDSGTFAGPDDEQETLSGRANPPPVLPPDAENQSSAASSETDLPQSAIRTEVWHGETSGAVIGNIKSVAFRSMN